MCVASCWGSPNGGAPLPIGKRSCDGVRASLRSVSYSSERWFGTLPPLLIILHRMDGGGGGDNIKLLVLGGTLESQSS
jgi:hypothetical protein